MDLFDEFITSPMGLPVHLPASLVLPHTQSIPHPHTANGHTQDQMGDQISSGIRNLPVREMGEKRTPRLRRSCELCRNSKGRCCPSLEGRGCLRLVIGFFLEVSSDWRNRD